MDITEFLKLVVIGFLVSLGLRDFYPRTQQRTFRHGTCIAVLFLVTLVDDYGADYGISPGLALAIRALGFGVAFSDLFALVMHDKRIKDVKHVSSIQEPKGDPKDNPTTPENGSVVAKPKQDEHPTDEKTLAMHKHRERIISGAKPNEHDKWQARAFPNDRLKVAFRINNCFTNKTEKRCKKFRGEVEQLLHPAGDYEPHWRDLVETARTVARAELSASSVEMKLSDAVQMTVMKTMLKVLFKMSPTDTSKDRQIRRLAKEINYQWVKSKKGHTPNVTPVWDFEQQKIAKNTAEQIFGEWSADNTDNPFNYLLPGYETMWRVVLKCVTELTSTRHPTNSIAWKERLTSFIRNPTKDQLQKAANDHGLTAQHISFETLRLYPPTRRMTRRKQYNDGSERNMIADIELMHHKAPVWQPDPESFRPERWTALPNGVHTKGFMPFGCYPFNCPAKQSFNVPIPFGVSMIAVLTGCFIEAMADAWCLDGEDLLLARDPLMNNRDDSDNVLLRRLGADPLMLTFAEQKLFKASDADDTVVDDTATGDTAADDTAADNITTIDTATIDANAGNTNANNTTADNTAVDNAAVDNTAADETSSNKTDDEAKTALSDTNGPVAEDEEQTAAAQQ